MKTYNRIVICGRPGHFRDSLAAVLKTLPRSELFLVDSLDPASLDQFSGSDLTLILADLYPVSAATGSRLDLVKQSCPDMLSIALVDNPQQSRAALAMGVDYTLARSASAGELLAAIQHLTQRAAPMTSFQSSNLHFVFSG
ncbi:MAG: hypothetical protein B6D39_03570 [Anaerolineae bacterium UTCFX2]|jgi:DNA-binding NarL/FixJ family response regulator|nr:response regulator transcription factor [Anaerolineae bacterium]MCZ7553021.1 hypothetical protein [Anaerolineales bacterium]OQY93118.1 MAG: hypothetical protein B6D39_03570 [Anaerolineae bacterium UTCFX2]